MSTVFFLSNFDDHLRVRATVKDPSPATQGILGIG